MSHLRSELSCYSAASNLSQNNLIRQRKQAGEQLVNLGFGQAPFPVPARGVQALQQHASNTLYLPADGILELREAVANFHRHFDGFQQFSADSVVCGPGSKELIFLILAVFDGAVFVASPSWTTYQPQTLLTGKKCVQVPLSKQSGWRITADALEAALPAAAGAKNRLLIINNPDNPTGVAYAESHLQELASWLRKENFLVISDEIYARLHFNNCHTSLAHYYAEGTIVTSGLSKWASAGGWRVGYAMFPQQLQHVRAAVASAATHTYSCVAAPVQYGAVELMANLPAAEELLPHCQRILAAVARQFETLLTAAGAELLPAEGGFYLMPDFEAARPKLNQQGINTGAAMCDKILSETGIALMSAGPAFLRPDTELTVRLCFVDFDGGAALAASREVGIDTPLPSDFTYCHCQPAHDAAVRLADWLRRIIA